MSIGKVTPERFAHLKHLKQKHREAYEAEKDARRELEAYQAELFEDMRAEGSLSWKGDIGAFSRKSTIYAQVTDREAFHEFLRAHGMEDEFLRQTEEKARLNELVRTLVDNGEELPPGVTFYSKDYISITEN